MSSFTRRSAPSLVRHAIEPLEPRRLLANAYPVLPLAGHTWEITPRTSANGEAHYVMGGQLYRSDGTAAGTTSVASIVDSLFNWNGTLFYGARSFSGGDGLYRLDPGSSTPVEIRHASGARLSRPSNFVAVGDKLYFSASIGGVISVSLCVTDGTSAGTRSLGEGAPVGGANGFLLFTTSNGAPTYSQTLWRTDGTFEGMVRLRDDFHASMGQPLGGVVLFNGPDGLWKSDGTVAGTVKVKDGAYGITEWHRVGDAAYFTNAVTGRPSGLWKTDGTEAGTVLLGDIFSGNNLSTRSAPSMAHVGNTLYYVAYPATGPSQLFATEGPGTTRRITNIGTDRVYHGVTPLLAAVDGKVLFSGRSTGPDRLWESTGAVGNFTAVPGEILHEVGDVEYGPLNLLTVGGSLFYTRRVYNGPTRLWRYGVSPSVLDENGVLVVNGTDPAEGGNGHDAIAVSLAGDTLTATVNGSARSFPAAAVRRVAINGLGGDDGATVTGLTGVPLTFNGGVGQDSLGVTGTDGDDVVTVTSAPNPGPGGGVHTSNVENVTLDTLGGADRVTLANLRHAMTLQGGGGDDELVLDDAARSGAENYALSDSAFGRGAGGGAVAMLLSYGGVEAVTLHAGSGPNVVTVTPSGATRFTVNGNAPAPPDAARDRLSLDVRDAAGARHQGGAAPGEGQWTFSDRRPVTFTGFEQTDDGVPLTADVVDVAPDPRTSPVAEFRIVFSEPVTGFDLADLRLTRGGAPDNLLSGATLTGTDGVNWTLGNLSGVTGLHGQYTLTLGASGSGVVDGAGSPLADSATETFSVDHVPPAADVENVSPDPRGDPVNSVRVLFTEPVAGLAMRHFRLTRDGGDNLLTAEQTLTQTNPTTWTINNLGPLTRSAGQYQLALTPLATTEVADLAGNLLPAAAEDSWRTWAQVRGRHLFYNGSARDGRSPAVDARDDSAIAPDKRALLPGQGAGFANYTSYDKGITGVMIDVTGLAAGLTAADFAFRAGNTANPATWAAAPAPAAISIRPGAGVNGSDRVTLTWPDYAVRNRWLQVRLLSTAASGLPAAGDVFYVGNLGGETGNSPRGVGHTVDPGDLNGTRNQIAMRDLPLNSRWDHNKDGFVSPADVSAVIRNLRAAPLRMFTAPPGAGAAAPPASAGGETTTAGPGSSTPSPSAVLAAINAGSGVGGFVNINGKIYFSADDGVHGSEPWVTDGTPEGTVMVADVNPGPAGSSPRRFENVRGIAVFAANDGAHGEEPWRSDGTAAGTYLLEDVNPGSAGSDPWAPLAYDGSRRALEVGGVLYFRANRPDEGVELWRTDGTAYGTYLLRDVVPGPASSGPEGMTAANGNLFFSAGNGNNAMIWRTTGRAATTVPVPGTNGQPILMTALGGHVYYRTAGFADANKLLRRTDGFASAPTTIRELPGTISGAPVDVNGTLFMSVLSFQGVGGYELWKSDGTTAGTVRVGDPSNFPFYTQHLVSFNGAAYFIARGQVSGWEVWRSDGTTAGTQLLRDVNVDGDSFPQSLTVIDGMLYFTATEPGVGRQVWRSDGTEPGTVRLSNVPGGVADQLSFAKKDGYVYFGANHPDFGWELWRTDGTATGTVLFKDINRVGAG